MEGHAGMATGMTFGFLTTVESPSHGIFGGYLIVDPVGRPLEFHCTAPIQVSRAQRILYGPTLEEHLFGRQIGGTLLAEASTDPVVVLVDAPPLFHVRRHTSLAVAFIERVTADGPGSPAAAPPDEFTLGSARVAATTDPTTVRGRLEDLAESVDLCEPFERIRLAIAEAQRS
jgi:hypothetical protein